MQVVLGLLFHALGGFAAGSFYLPIRRVRGWSWETSWFVLGLAAWLVVPIVMALLTTPRPLALLAAAPAATLGWSFLFGLLWGVGGLTFGLSLRYLGIGLGMAVALGLCAAFGTLIPPVYEGRLGELLATPGGRQTLLGVVVCLVGIGLCGYAGKLKEGEQDEATKRAAVAEFDLGKGLGVAFISGLLSACFAFALAAGEDLAVLAEAAGAAPLFRNNLSLVVILLGGLVTNLSYCAVLFYRNGSFSELGGGSAGHASLPPSLAPASAPEKQETDRGKNTVLSALGGATWYFQFFFYGMGAVYLGERYDFASWTIHMAFIILFSTLWGLYLREWAGSSGRVIAWLVAGLVVLVGSTALIGLA